MNDLAKQNEAALVPVEAETTTERLIRVAFERGLNPTELYAILDKERQARALQSYNIAKGNFLERCPRIIEKKRGGGITKSGAKFEFPYADMSDIIDQAFPALRELGFSWDFSLVVLGDNQRYQRCYLRHRDGHVHTADVPYLPDEGGHMNAVQKIGSGLTYCERYALLQALGLPTTTFDPDGGPIPKGSTITEAQANSLNDSLLEVHADMAAFKRVFQIEKLADLPAKDLDRAYKMIESKKKATPK